MKSQIKSGCSIFELNLTLILTEYFKLTLIYANLWNNQFDEILFLESICCHIKGCQFIPSHVPNEISGSRLYLRLQLKITSHGKKQINQLFPVSCLKTCPIAAVVGHPTLVYICSCMPESSLGNIQAVFCILNSIKLQI